MTFEKGNEWRWKPGQSGNPKGRPKNISTIVTDRLKTLRADGRCLADDLVDDLLRDAQSDEPGIRMATRKELLARVYPIISKMELDAQTDNTLRVSWKKPTQPPEEPDGDSTVQEQQVEGETREGAE